ncbi:hypothetical protein NDU88_008631 [Pleurodeles waltl]|uniref:Uncharacterized protein n=1 Tax=Pleurodeles waltl TaxID=8319 RepID=A0AAV7NX41_PLEWA|nr:hypothetical protein NDU88_008631 [Pleurodeles waltl]
MGPVQELAEIRINMFGHCPPPQGNAGAPFPARDVRLEEHRLRNDRTPGRCCAIGAGSVSPIVCSWRNIRESGTHLWRREGVSLPLIVRLWQCLPALKLHVGRGGNRSVIPLTGMPLTFLRLCYFGLGRSQQLDHNSYRIIAY